jgi:hypothetical protein
MSPEHSDWWWREIKREFGASRQAAILRRSNTPNRYAQIQKELLLSDFPFTQIYNARLRKVTQ